MGESTERKPLWQLDDEQLKEIARGDWNAAFGPEAPQARKAAEMLLINRTQQRDNPQAFSR